MPRAVNPSSFAAACTRLAERDAFPALVLAAMLVFLLRLTPHQLVADSWLALVAGREIVDNGLPAGDTLAVWTHGTTWIDQQWLAHVALYALAAAAGIKAALAANVAAVIGAFAGAAVASRRLGASGRSVAFVALPCMFASFWAYQLRAQSLAYPLFVAVLWLLASDARNASRRVLLVLPLLVVWTNVHGSVVLGALLVVLYGAVTAVRALTRRATTSSAAVARALTVAAAAPLCLFASPYGLSLADYYRSILLNSSLSRVVVEWQASTPSALTAVFFALAFATVWLVGRHGASLTPFERVALGVTLLGGLLAIRSIVWFALAALMFVPVLLDHASPVRELPKRRLSILLVAAAAVGAVGATADAARLPAAWYAQNEPGAAGDAVAVAASRDRHARIFATEPYADFLLWQHPELGGRIAFDVRFELFSDDQFRRVLALYELRRSWRETLRGFRLVVLERSRTSLVRALLDEGGARVIYGDGE